MRGADRGFTFIEIVVVLLILALLVALGLTAYLAVRQRPHRAGSGDIFRGVRAAWESSASHLPGVAARVLGDAGVDGPPSRDSLAGGE